MGAHKLRLKKVMSILQEQDLQIQKKTFDDKEISVIFLPCVATFDSYEDKSGNNIRYLVSLNYFRDLVSEDADDQNHPATLLELFDSVPTDTKNDTKSKEPLFPLIAGIAVGSGIESKDDEASILKYFATMIPPLEPGDFPVDSLQPSEGYSSMKEELDVYKQLSSDEKLKATKQRTMGPAKMAKFVSDFAVRLIDEKIEEHRQQNEVPVEPEEPQTTESATLREVDSTKDRFACRMCRFVLFGEDDFQDPPHVPSQHKFGHRKHGGSGGNMGDGSPCQSHFLQEGFDWMGDMGEAEGKFGCPKCSAKLGTWHWSGAQCSCGTWVIPAIQIPKSRVDLISPQTSEFPSGTIVSPIAILQQEQQRRLQNLGL